MINQSFDMPKPYERAALYSYDSDCVEYLREDSFCIYERIDSRLTLIKDDDGELIGFKIKGFRNTFERLKASFALSDHMFVPLVSALEAIFTEIGDEHFANPAHRAAYQAAYGIAANDNVKLSTTDWLAAEAA